MTPINAAIFCPVLLFAVLVSLFQGGKPAAAQTKKSVKLSPAAVTNPTYNRDIAPIIQRQCASCHRPDSAGPFPLLRYQDLARRAEQIGIVTKSRYMPPWKPSPESGPFHDAAALTEAQIALIQTWVQQGAKEGEPAAAPKPPIIKDDWKLGKPDLVLEMPEAFTLRADATETQEIYRSFILLVPISEDKMVVAVEYKPSNPRIVRHITIQEDTTGISHRLQAQSGAVGYTAFHSGLSWYPAGSFYDWTPGVSPRFLPSGVAKPLKKGVDLILQIHFLPTGRAETERSKVAIYFAKTPPRVQPATIMLGTSELYLRPTFTAEVKDSYTLPVAVQILGITPNAHNTCTHVKAIATLPDGSQKNLLTINDWDLDWAAPYTFVTPLHLPAQTKLTMEYTYDNTRVNPRDPNRRPHFVIPGWGTMEEMGSLWVQVIAERPADQTALVQSLPPATHKPEIIKHGDDDEK